MNLLPEFQKIVDEEIASWIGDHKAAARVAVESVAHRFQELALRVPEMSDAEIREIYDLACGKVHASRIRAVLAAYEAKRWASPDIPFDYNEWQKNPDEWEVYAGDKKLNLSVGGVAMTMRRVTK